MSELVNIKINGKDYEVPAGINLIDAAESVGVHIPNLCYLKGMKGIGACRMCFVEVDGKTMTACIMRTKKGMVIDTESERVKDLRRFVVDMLISMHPLDCMTCTKAGRCSLQKYAYDCGIKETTYNKKSFNFPVDEANPFIKRDPDYCVLCGRCVRVCKEQGTAVLDFAGRGVGSKVSTAGDKPLQDGGCTFCGSCVDACPVNALVEADRWRRGREWEFTQTNSVCMSCGCACEVGVSTFKGDIVKVRAGAEKGKAEAYICALGRYGHDSLRSDLRVLEPLKKVNGKLEPTTWDDALNILASRIRETNSGVITTAGITNEDALTLKALVQKANIANLATTVGIYGDEASLIGGQVDIDSADLIVLVGLYPDQWMRFLPALDAIIRKKVDRKAKLVVINNKASKLSSIADIAIEGDEAEVLKAIAKAMADGGVGPHEGMDLSGANVTENDEKVDKLFKEAANPMIITAPKFYEAAQNIAFIKGSVVAMPMEANAKGVLLMGLKDSGKSYKEMTAAGAVSTIYAIGGLPLNVRPNVEFLAVQSAYMTAIAAEADLVLPVCAPLECGGSIVDYLGRLREKTAAVEQPGEAKTNMEVFIALAKALGVDIETPSRQDVEKLAAVTFNPTIKPFNGREGIEVPGFDMFISMNSCIVNGSRLAWLVENMKNIQVA